MAGPGHIMRHGNFVFFLDTRATDTLFLNDATLFPREGLADPTCVSFESYNYRGYYLTRNASLGLALLVPTSDLGAATFRWSSASSGPGLTDWVTAALRTAVWRGPPAMAAALPSDIRAGHLPSGRSFTAMHSLCRCSTTTASWATQRPFGPSARCRIRRRAV